MRLPVAFGLGNRDETSDKDERLLNCFAEESNGQLVVIKRPGLSPYSSLTAGSTTQGQMLFSYAQPGAAAFLMGIRGDLLNVL